MTQKEFDLELERLHSELAIKMKEAFELQDKISEHRANSDLILIEHALIPIKYKTIDEWLEGHPFPDTVNSMRFKNRATALSVQYSCNTYLFDYHVVKTYI